MNKTKKKWILFLMIICFIIIAVMIYTRPQTFKQRYPFIDLTECVQIQGYYSDGINFENIHFVITQEDAHYDGVIDLIQSIQFKNKISNIFPETTKYHVYGEDDFRWDMTFKFEDVQLSNGEIASGDILGISNFYGNIELFFNGKYVQCTTKKVESWTKAVLEMIKQ